MTETDYITPILTRKRREIVRRQRHAHAQLAAASSMARAELACAALRRGDADMPRVIAEIKRRSPSAGMLRAPQRGDVVQLARAYAAGGAAAISVLCDGPGFAGSPLDLRRAAAAVQVPVLFKEFVLDELQIALAQAVGAHMVLLIVRALPTDRLRALCDATLAAGLAPVVEAASGAEVEVALGTQAPIIGVNARDLRTFKVDPQAAQSALQAIPRDRIAVHMSGVHSPEDYRMVGAGRADAVLIGESLMRAQDPSEKLRGFFRG
jgi:indole-3-glycerol phosphate synthase